MSVSQNILLWIAKRLKIPSDAMNMFKASNEISGIDKKTLPVELIPLNSIQLSRGLLNFTVLQSKLDWVFPFWVNQQYDPGSKSFIPRSHLGLSMNITHRNWTAAGNPECDVEPIVDPRGLVTPFKNGWSIDAWLVIDDKIFLPSAAETAEQNLIDDIPVVKTKYEFENIEFTLITYSYKDNLFFEVHVMNSSAKNIPVKIVISIRPFNPEGISLLNKIVFNENESSFKIYGSIKKDSLYFTRRPDFIHCSNFKNGDSVKILSSKHNGRQNISSVCTAGLANALACFHIDLLPFSNKVIEAYIPLSKQGKYHSYVLPEVKLYWENILNKGAEINIPDTKLNSIVRSSISTLLMLTDADTITPGPFTYHQFWFRDAAYMVWALDSLGYHSITKKIIKSFPFHQTKNGYFRSQKGEWDSNGQAIWTIFRHYSFTKDTDLISSLFDSLFAAVKWISNKRLTGQSFSEEDFFGLMPAGMSAEHLGLADHYFWDNFWSLAGIKSFIDICKVLGREEELKFAEALNTHYRLAVDVAIENVQMKYSLTAIPASPSRDVDCGMIGSICAGYPLQLFEANDKRITDSLNLLKQNYFVNGLFFQHFIHSGMNPYLTLQVAHSYLYAGKRELFWEILNNVVSFSSPTNNYPEAIHPFTKGGSMGDGHHGWAAAEIVLALRDAFIYENSNSNPNEIIFLQGIPGKWFLSSKNFYIKNVPTSDGSISIFIEPVNDVNEINIMIEFHKTKDTKSKWILNLPFENIEVKDGSRTITSIKAVEGNSIINLIPGFVQLTLIVQSVERSIMDSRSS